MKRHRVLFVEEAERDLADIVHYIAIHDTPSKARQVLQRLEDLCESLAALPSRGHCPPELERLGVTIYREVHFKPYRVIYQVIERDAVVHAILDSRRDMQALLERRMLR